MTTDNLFTGRATPKGQQLDGLNLQEVLDSGANAEDVGRQQFFTADDLATALMLPLPEARHTFIDLQMGSAALLKASNSPHLIGCDIDPRCARKPDGAAGEWHTLTADVTKLYPLLAEIGWRFDLGGFNPPFSIKWHNDRLAALRDSECDAVRAAYRPHHETIDSTLATAMIALDRLNNRGEFFLICNQSTAVRHFGPPDFVAPPRSFSGTTERILPDCGGGELRKHIWLWVTLPAGIFANVHHDFETAVLYFARDHENRGQAPLHLVSTSPDPAAITQMLRPWQSRRQLIRHGNSLWRVSDFDKATIANFDAAKQEYAAQHRTTRAQEFNIWLSEGRIRRHLTPFQHFSKRIPKDLIASLNDLDNRTPMELVVQKETRVALQRAVRSTFWSVDPALIAAVDAAVSGYNANRAPFYPLSDVQRLGFLDETDQIQFGKLGIEGFQVGEFYPITCSTCPTERDGSRINIMGEEEMVTYHGQDLVVKIQDANEEWHAFTTEPDVTDIPKGIAARHSMASLVEHFIIPEVHDVAITQSERYLRNVAKIEAIEEAVRKGCRPDTTERTAATSAAVNRNQGVSNTGKAPMPEFSCRHYQRDDLARFAVHDGGILGWDPGLGKTLGMGIYPQIKDARRVLIVAPDSLHQQIIDDLFNLLGLEVHLLRNQEDYFSDKTLQQAAMDLINGVESEARGWWITSYTQLGMNGGDQWEDKETDEGARYVTRKIMDMRQKHERFAPEHDFGCGLLNKAKTVRCLYRPTLATLTAELFDCVQVDEGVRLKGDHSYISTGVRQMRPKYRAVMTGTPIKNRLDDIFWLCHWAAGGNEEACSRWPYPNTVEAKNEFADQHMLIEENHTKAEREYERTGNKRRFEKRTAQLTNVHRLWKLLCNVVIRRRKDDIGEDIVPKTVVPITIPPGTAQQAVYAFHLANPPEFRKDGQEMNKIAAIVTQLQMLRQAALCPDSPNLSADQMSLHRIRMALLAEKEKGTTSTGPFDAKATSRAIKTATLADRPGTEGEGAVALAMVEKMLAGTARIDLAAVLEAAPSLRTKLQALAGVDQSTGRMPKNARSWTDHNPKQTAILKLIEELLSKGEQVVIMSPFQHFSESLHKRLVQASVSVCLLDGNTSPSKRGQLSKAFKRFKYSVMIGGIQSMGEGHSWDQCSNLIMPSLEWAFDKNRQAEDRVHRLTSKKPVTIYTMVTTNSVDQRLYSLYMEKSDSSHLALDGKLFADRTEEVSLGQLLNEAAASFDAGAATISELELEKEWENALKHKLRLACQRFGEWHPPIAMDADGTKPTKSQVRKAVNSAGLQTMVTIVKAVPSATFGALIGSRDAGMIEQLRRDFVAFCERGEYSDWRRAWSAFDRQREKVTSPAKARISNAMAALKAL
jgi:hypothetical protein